MDLKYCTYIEGAKKRRVPWERIWGSSISYPHSTLRMVGFCKRGFWIFSFKKLTNFGPLNNIFKDANKKETHQNSFYNITDTNFRVWLFRGEGGGVGG